MPISTVLHLLTFSSWFMVAVGWKFISLLDLPDTGGVEEEDAEYH